MIDHGPVVLQFRTPLFDLGHGKVGRAGDMLAGMFVGVGDVNEHAPSFIRSLARAEEIVSRLMCSCWGMRNRCRREGGEQPADALVGARSTWLARHNSWPRPHGHRRFGHFCPEVGLHATENTLELGP